MVLPVRMCTVNKSGFGVRQLTYEVVNKVNESLFV